MKLELTNPRSVALVDGILSSGTPPGALHIGVVPLRRDAADAPSSASGVELADFPDPDDVVDVRERLHDIGVAARIIQVVRTSGPKRGYTLLLEGRCRFEVAHLVAVSPAPRRRGAPAGRSRPPRRARPLKPRGERSRARLDGGRVQIPRRRARG